MKRIYQLALMLMLLSVEGIGGAQTIWPVANDVVISMYNGMGNTNRYIEADKTGRLQFLMYGQDPSPGAPVGQLRPQRRVFGPSIVCGNTFDATCDVVASAVSIYAAQIADSSAAGRSVLTASDATAARLAIGAGTSNFDGTYAGLTGVPSTFAPSAHTHTAAQISDATGAGRSVLTAPDASAIRALLGVPSASDIATSYYPLSSNPAGYLVSSALTPYLTTATAASTYATQTSLATGLATKFNSPTGTTAQYLRGDGSTATFPAIPTVTAFNFSAPAAKTVALSTAYQAADPAKAAIVTLTPACTNATTVLAASACTMQVRQSSAAGLTCSTGTVVATWSSTIALGLVITQGNSFPLDIKLPIGGYFITCPSAGTFILTAVEQSAG